jgi:hypothetical protein
MEAMVVVDLPVLEAMLHQAVLMEAMVVYQVVDQALVTAVLTLYLEGVMEVLAVLVVVEAEVMEVLNALHRLVVLVALGA